MPNLSVGGAQLSVALTDIIKNQRGDDAAYRAKKGGRYGMWSRFIFQSISRLGHYGSNTLSMGR